MDTLADELYTNRLQLKEDLLCWESMLRMFHLKITKGTHLHIDGDERQLRLFVLYYFYQRADKAMIMSIEPRMPPIFLLSAPPPSSTAISVWMQMLFLQ